MRGFKSFAEPVTIEFDEGITCIVGPNGSGKSNISDAVRWVLGEQSPKMLRGGKMEEVIFSGTESRKSRGMAEVTLVIDNSGGMLPIDYNEVAITRRMYRSGESEYAINNNQCRLRDIRELIMDTGIGVDGYSLIGQGKIADIVSNKTESRREIFEEVAGIVMYRTRKEETERKLRSTTDNLDRINDIVWEIEGRIGRLKKDSEKAVEYLKLKERYKELEINIILKNIESADLKNEYLRDDIIQLEENIAEKKELAKTTDEELAENRDRSEELTKLNNEARDRLMASTEEISRLTGEKQLTEERLDAIEKDSQRLAEELASIKEKSDREERNAGEIREKKREIDRVALKLEQELNDMMRDHKRIASEMTSISEVIADKRNELFKVHGAVSSKKEEAAGLESLKETLRSRRHDIKSEKDQKEGNNKDTLDNLNRARTEYEDMTKQFEALKEEIKELSAFHEKDIKNAKVISNNIEKSKVEVGIMTARKKTIEEMEANYEGYSRAVKFVMKEDIDGIEGTVAELITVRRGYETAVETALGGHLQNIICRDDESAKRAIARLKESKEGRLTFLPISSIRAHPIKDKTLESAKGFNGYASEYADHDEKYANVMDFLLGRFAVTDNMDSAVKFAKKSPFGLKYVTIEGELINAGGAITGGRYKNSTANLLKRRAEITALEKKLESAEKEIKKAEEQVSEINAEILSIKKKMTGHEERLHRFEMDIVIRENSIKAMENSVLEFKTSSETWQRELSDIEKELRVSDGMIGKLKEDIENGENSLKAIEQELEERQNTYSEKKAYLDEANEMITGARVDKIAAQTEKQNADRLAERVESALFELVEERKTKEAALAAIEVEKESLIADGTGVEDKVREKQAAKADIEKYIRVLSDERARVTQAVDKMTRLADSVNTELASLQDSKYEVEIKKARQETHIDNLKNKLWENFEVSFAQAQSIKNQDFVMTPAVKESRSIVERMRELGDVNVGAIKEYESISERYRFLTEQRDDIIKSMDSLNNIIVDMDRTIKAKFRESFDMVVINFEKVFKDLFGGGHAQLLLQDESDPLTSTIDIVAQPPGKALKNINLLSGGEKAMTAIALMFAVLKTKPTPFCILDEVEAALDDANIDRFGTYLKSSFKDIQFALVTHKKATMEYADALYGVTMPEQGVSKVLSLKMEDIQKREVSPD